MPHKIPLQSLVTPELYEKVKNVLNYKSKSSPFRTTPLGKERIDLWKLSDDINYLEQDVERHLIASEYRPIEQGKRGDVEIYLIASEKKKCLWCQVNFLFRVNLAVIEISFRKIGENWIGHKYTTHSCLRCFKLYLRKLVNLRFGEIAIPEGYENLPDEVISSIVDSLPKLPREISARILTERLEAFKR